VLQNRTLSIVMLGLWLVGAFLVAGSFVRRAEVA